MRFLSYACCKFQCCVASLAVLIAIIVITPAAAAPSSTVRFAAIGDYGWAGSGEQQVADLIEGWSVDFIITQGDNNYEDGESQTIDQNIGQYYQAYIGNYTGSYGFGSTSNRFFPALGNHDWRTEISGLPQVYLDYFTLPGNERYYRYIKGPVEFFVLDSDAREPDGITFNSVQGQWLKNALADSTAEWKIVYMHHSPYSSERSSPNNGSRPLLQWPYDAWGADAVISAHDHVYQRLKAGDIPYFVNGLGGKGIRALGPDLPETVVQHNGNYGAMLITADAESITFEFYYVDDGGIPIDSLTLSKNNTPPNVVRVQVASSFDDAEESATGVMSLNSSDLELVDESSNQTVGMRFSGVDIPQGVTVTNAYIQFVVDEISTGESDLTITGQAADDAARFSSSSYDISSRPSTAASISWKPVEWSDVASAGIYQRTPNLDQIIQEIIDRPGWNRGQSLAIMVKGSGRRVAESYDGPSGGGGAPLLYVEYNQSNDDHVGSCEMATAIEPNSATAGMLETGGDVDYFRIVIPGSGTLTVSSGGDIDVKGALEDSSGSLLATDDNSGLQNNFSITYSVTAGTYCIRVEGNDEAEKGSYGELVSSYSPTTIADISVSDSSAPSDDLQIPFGEVTQMAFSDHVVTVNNDGNANLDIGDIATANPLLAPFGIVNDACSRQTISPDGSCTFTIRFEPTEVGSFSDTLDIPSNDPDDPSVIVRVSGNGVAQHLVANITVTGSTIPLDDLQVVFGDVAELTSSDQTVMITNDGAADLIIGDIAQANPLEAPFEMLTDNCSTQTLVSAAKCAVVVRFTPTSTGETFEDHFDIPSSDLDQSSLTIRVKGTGVRVSTNGRGSGGSSKGGGGLDPLFVVLLAILYLLSVVSRSESKEKQAWPG